MSSPGFFYGTMPSGQMTQDQQDLYRRQMLAAQLMNNNGGPAGAANDIIGAALYKHAQDQYNNRGLNPISVSGQQTLSPSLFSKFGNLFGLGGAS